jgi:hypothetical protein
MAVTSGSWIEIDFDIDKMSFDAIDRGTPSFEKHEIFRMAG